MSSTSTYISIYLYTSIYIYSIYIMRVYFEMIAVGTHQCGKHIAGTHQCEKNAHPSAPRAVVVRF